MNEDGNSIKAEVAPKTVMPKDTAETCSGAIGMNDLGIAFPARGMSSFVFHSINR